MRFSIDRFSIKPFASGFLHVPLFLVHSSLRVKLILLLDRLIAINFDVAKAEKEIERNLAVREPRVVPLLEI